MKRTSEMHAKYVGMDKADTLEIDDFGHGLGALLITVTEGDRTAMINLPRAKVQLLRRRLADWVIAGGGK